MSFFLTRTSFRKMRCNQQAMCYIRPKLTSGLMEIALSFWRLDKRTLWPEKRYLFGVSGTQFSNPQPTMLHFGKSMCQAKCLNKLEIQSSMQNKRTCQNFFWSGRKSKKPSITSKIAASLTKCPRRTLSFAFLECRGCLLWINYKSFQFVKNFSILVPRLSKNGKSDAVCQETSKLKDPDEQVIPTKSISRDAEDNFNKKI